MRVIVETTESRHRAGKAANGRDYSFFVQRALLKGERCAGEIELIHDSEATIYAPGEYEFDYDRSISIGRFGALRFSPVLKPSRVGPAVAPVRTGTTG